MQALHLMELLITYATRLYVLGGELLSITTILFCLNLFASLTRHSYRAGQAVGSFYWRWLHKHCQWLAVRLVALLVLLASLSFQAIKHAWMHRREYLEAANNARNTIGKAFSYRSPSATPQKLLCPAPLATASTKPFINQLGTTAEELFLLTNKQLKLIAGTNSNYSKRVLVSMIMAS